MKDFETILYETPADHIARIVLNRTETRNAQAMKMLARCRDPQPSQASGVRHNNAQFNRNSR